MTRTEFISQLDMLKQRTPVFVFLGLTLGLLHTSTAIYWLFFYRPYVTQQQVLYSGLTLFTIYLVTVGALVWGIKRCVARYAPSCQDCGGRITWRERDQILTSGQCPRCHSQFFT